MDKVFKSRDEMNLKYKVHVGISKLSSVLGTLLCADRGDWRRL